MANASDYLTDVKIRLKNPAVQDAEVLAYITDALLDLDQTAYSANDFYAQVLDSTCHLLAIDGKFPEITSISASGVSTSLSANDPERFRRRMAARRQASWMG